jgi:hypothetical protein
MARQPETTSRSRRACLIAALVCAGLLLGHRPVPATDCVTSTASLTLLEVSEDGVPVTDLAVHRQAKVVLYSRAPGEVEVVARAREFANAFWRESYRASAVPGR